MGQYIELMGEIQEIIYRNESNGYTVLELATADASVTAVGIMPFVSNGETLMLTGTYKTHPAYGEQFSVESCQRQMPTTSSSILKYLSSGAVKGIGPATAQLLVKQFGDSTMEVMKNEPIRLAQIRGISKDKALKIGEQVKEIFGLREVMLLLEKFGISPAECVRAWKYLGNDAVDIIKQNPYVLCMHGIDVPFDKADKIAMKDDAIKESDYRIRAGLVYVLEHNKNNGHTCLPQSKLAEITAQYLETELTRTQDMLQSMIDDTTLCHDVINGKDFVFLKQLYDAETYSAGRLQLFMHFPAKPIEGIDKEIEEIEKNENISYAELQKEAIHKALSTGLLILTGGPGTGKTTTLNAIIKILQKNGEKVALAAPTGRAAQRMSQLTGREAKTIHRLLEVCFNDDDHPIFKRNEKNRLACDTLILDELSMIDSMLFESVMRALPMGCRLIMVGDSDQLPSVGAGNVLGDMIASGAVPVVQLKEIFRQSMESLIVTNAHRIVSGELPRLDVRDSDFFFLQCNSPEMISKTIVDLCRTRLPKSYGFSPLNDIQVLSPGKKGVLGTFELNKMLQQALNPPDGNKKEINIMGKIFRQGDKVMQVRNNYNISFTKKNGESGEGIYNGDVGILSQLNRASGSLTVEFDDKTAVYEGEDVLDLELAYALTVHKSQGNEFEAVIMPMYRGALQLCYRNLLYTAVTRAKKLLIMVGTPQTVSTMVENNRRTLRYTGLKEFITR